jgi:hypothetical protein
MLYGHGGFSLSWLIDYAAIERRTGRTIKFISEPIITRGSSSTVTFELRRPAIIPMSRRAARYMSIHPDVMAEVGASRHVALPYDFGRKRGIAEVDCKASIAFG